MQEDLSTNVFLLLTQYPELQWTPPGHLRTSPPVSPWGWGHCPKSLHCLGLWPCPGGWTLFQGPSTLCGKNFFTNMQPKHLLPQLHPIPLSPVTGLRVKRFVPALSCSSRGFSSRPWTIFAASLTALYLCVQSQNPAHLKALHTLLRAEGPLGEPAAPPVCCHQSLVNGTLHSCSQIVDTCVKKSLGSVWSDWEAQLSSVSTQVVAENFAFKFALSTRWDLKKP